MRHIQQLQAGVAAGRRAVRRALQFARAEVWDVNTATLSASRALGVRLLRIVLLVFKGFRDDECTMHASALTFSTLMAIVPILAIGLSVARGFGDSDSAKLWIQARVQGWTETFRVEAPAEPAMPHAVPPTLQDAAVQNELAARINDIVEKGFEKVENINFAKLGTVGLVLLIWMVIEVLGRVERSFNLVWGIARGRTVWRRFTDYLSVLLVLPVLVVAAASLPVMDMVTRYMPSETAALFLRLTSSGLFKNLIVLALTTLAFTFFLMFMPNTTMGVRAGLTGGLVSAVLFLAWLWICAMLQVGAARYGRIYGSFAVVPIVLAWVHVSWQVVLFGAEVAFSVENCDTFRMEQSAWDANMRACMLLALAVVTAAARCMTVPSPPFDVAAYGHRRRIPVRFLNAVVAGLVQAGFMAELAGRQGCYVLLRAPAALPVSEVLDSVMGAGAGPDELGMDDADPKVAAAVAQALGGLDDRLGAVTVQDLLSA